MLDHVSIGVRDIAKAKGFYDAALKPLGFACLSADDSSLGYGKEGVGFWVNSAERPVADDPKSGLHFCFAARAGRASRRFMRLRSPMAGATTASPDCARITGRTITRLTSSIPRATGSKPISEGNKPMATIRSELTTRAPADEVWSAVRDIGALHTRLVPGFVVDTRLEPGARIVTFINGVTLRERSSRSTTRRDGWSGPPRAAVPSTITPRSRSLRCPAGQRPSSGPPTSCPTSSTCTSRGRSRPEWRRCSGHWTG